MKLTMLSTELCIERVTELQGITGSNQMLLFLRANAGQL